MPSYLDLEPGEKVVFEKLRHPINLVPFAISTVIVVLAAIYGAGWLALNPEITPSFVSMALVNAGLGLLGVISVAVFLAAVFIYSQNKVILTSMHYLQIDQFGLFNRSVNKLRLDLIQDVRGTRRGFFATIFNYGEILIETAGSEPNFLFKPVADPLNLSEEINDARHGFKN